MSKRRLDALSQHTDEFGIVERIHGNSKRLPSNSYSQIIIECLVSFIDNILGTVASYSYQQICLNPMSISSTAVFAIELMSPQLGDQSFTKYGKKRGHT